jgi:hypothetical protein
MTDEVREWVRWLRNNAHKPVTLAPRTMLDLANLIERLLAERTAKESE